MRALQVLVLGMVWGCADKGSDSTPDTTGDSGEDTTPPVDQDADGIPEGEDCDDTNPQVYPGADEVCDEVDNNCDGTVDEGVTSTFYADSDADGYGNLGSPVVACAAPSGTVEDSTDCDDTRSDVSPIGQEVCDTEDVDEDCDGLVNDADDSVDPTGFQAFYTDSDGDGYGDPLTESFACYGGPGAVTNGDDCDDTTDRLGLSCFVTFDGTTGTSWETLTAPSDALYSLQSFHKLGEPTIFNMYPQTGYAYDIATDAWSTIAAGPFDRVWYQMAPWEGDLYGIANGYIHQYDPDADAWTQLATYTGGDDYNMTESDEFGVIYGHSQAGSIISYDTLTGTVDYDVTGLGSQYETRMAYDPGTRALYFGAYNAARLYRYALETGTVTQLTSIPESQLNDIFCSDRSGHIYAAGASSGRTLWQYDIATDTWSSIPDLPSDHGNNGTCTVSEDGWLYVGAGSNRTFYRLALY